MKKVFCFLLIGMITVISLTSSAQIVTGVASMYRFTSATTSPTGTDTLKDAATLILKRTGVGVRTKEASIQCNALKLTGTAAATAILQSTTDGTNYLNHFGTSADTFSIGNSASLQSKIFDVDGSVDNKTRIGYQIKFIGTGTQTTQVQCVWRYAE